MENPVALHTCAGGLWWIGAAIRNMAGILLMEGWGLWYAGGGPIRSRGMKTSWPTWVEGRVKNTALTVSTAVVIIARAIADGLRPPSKNKTGNGIPGTRRDTVGFVSTHGQVETSGELTSDLAGKTYRWDDMPPRKRPLMPTTLAARHYMESMVVLTLTPSFPSPFVPQ